MNGKQAGDGGIENAFRNFLAFAVEHGVGEHVMADIADQHHAAAVQGHRALAIRGGVGAVGIECAGQRLAALLKIGGEGAIHDAEHVAVDEDLVLGVDSSDRVFHVENGGHGGLKDHIGDAGRIVLADGVVAVDDHIDVQAVVDQQDRGRRGGIALITDELRLVLECSRIAALELGGELAVFDVIGGDVAVVAGGERRSLIEECLGFCNHLVAAGLVVALAALARIVRYRVGTIEGVIEAAPACIRRVQRVARIGQRHDELWTEHGGEFFVDIRCLHVLGRGLRLQIADLLQEGGVGIHVERLAFVGLVPVVDLGLQGVAGREQFAGPGRQILDDAGQTRPEGVRSNAGAGGRFLGDKVGQNRSDLQTAGVDTCHDKSHGKRRKSTPFWGFRMR